MNTRSIIVSKQAKSNNQSINKNDQVENDTSINQLLHREDDKEQQKWLDDRRLPVRIVRDWIQSLHCFHYRVMVKAVEKLANKGPTQCGTIRFRFPFLSPTKLFSFTYSLENGLYKRWLTAIIFSAIFAASWFRSFSDRSR